MMSYFIKYENEEISKVGRRRMIAKKFILAGETILCESPMIFVQFDTSKYTMYEKKLMNSEIAVFYGSYMCTRFTITSINKTSNKFM